MAIEIAQEQIDRYEQDGVVLLRGVIEEEWVERLRVGIDYLMANPSPLYEDYDIEKGRFFNDFYMWRRIPEFREWVFDGPGPEITAALMRCDQVNMFYDQVLIKEPGTEKFTHWHQDRTYMAVDGHHFCSTWIPLDSISLENAVEFVRSSHRWGTVYAPFPEGAVTHGRPDGTASEFRLPDGGTYEGTAAEWIPDIEADRGAYDIVAWATEPGDCLVFEASMVHQGRANVASDARRRIVTTRWVGDDATYAVRKPAAEFPHDPPKNVRHGTPMRDYPEDFPKVWPR